MGLSCGMKCLKYLLFAFNLVFWVAGIAIMAVGIWSRIESKDFDTLLGSGGVTSAANIMIVAGVVVMVIGFVGCCGALRESKWMLVTYFILLLVIFILEIVAGIVAYTNKDDTIDTLKKNIRKTVTTSYKGTSDADESLTKAVDYIQEHLDCCGADSPSDWKNSSYFKSLPANNTAKVPESCCVAGNNGCISKDYSSPDIYQKGCIDAGEKWVKDHIAIVGGVGVAIACIQLLGMVFAICLCRAIDYEKI